MLPGTQSRSEGTEAHGQLLRASECVLCPGFIIESRGSPDALHKHSGHWLGCAFPGQLRALHQKLGGRAPQHALSVFLTHVHGSESLLSRLLAKYKTEALIKGL